MKETKVINIVIQEDGVYLAILGSMSYEEAAHILMACRDNLLYPSAEEENKEG